MLLVAGLVTSCSHRPVKARYWAAPPDKVVAFPEQDPAGPVWPDLENKADLGLCFSGGGTRAATAAIGQLRALQTLEVLPRVRYISAVSGGSWATTPYTFMEQGRLADFLGCYVAPEDLTLDDLCAKPDSWEDAVSRSLVTGRALGKLFVLRGSESYSRTISDLFLKKFDLDDEGQWFSWNQATAKDIISLNRELADTPHHTVPAGRPFLVVGGTIRNYDYLRWSSRPSKRIPIEFTPYYSGVRPWHAANQDHAAPIGGGYIESFAYDSMNPKAYGGSGVAEVNLHRRFPWRGTEVVTLGDLVGISGAAPGEFQGLVELLGFPKMNHWSPGQLVADGKAVDVRHYHQDGGLSENLGLLPLLARKVKRIVAFVNAEEPVILGNTKQSFPDYISAYFGFDQLDRYDGTRVFDYAGLDDIALQIEKSIGRGGPAVARTSLRVRANRRFGVEPYDVEILWVFLEARILEGDTLVRSASRNWIGKVKSGPVSAILKTESLENFPAYKTFLEGRDTLLWDVIRLSEHKATLLSHYTAWVVTQTKPQVDAFLAAP